MCLTAVCHDIESDGCCIAGYHHWLGSRPDVEDQGHGGPQATGAGVDFTDSCGLENVSRLDELQCRVDQCWFW